MTIFEGWAKSCTESNTELWPIYEAIGRSETGLYMTKGVYWSGNNRFYTSSVWTVWIDGDRVFVSMDMKDALNYWKRRCKIMGIKYK